MGGICKVPCTLPCIDNNPTAKRLKGGVCALGVDCLYTHKHKHKYVSSKYALIPVSPRANALTRYAYTFNASLGYPGEGGGRREERAQTLAGADPGRRGQQRQS
eukprot:scaffold24728_cov32-Tisochrysis_lutea.AAC.3